MGHSKILALTGKYRLDVLTSAERGETVTVKFCWSALGSYVPPYLIFSRKRKRPKIESGLPPGFIVETNDSAWVTDAVFKLFKKFVKFSEARKKFNSTFDGHASYT